jgi:hypothetical protein
MKFFLPVQETKIAEESYQAIKKFIEMQSAWPMSDRRCYEIHYRHNDQDLSARVGDLMLRRATAAIGPISESKKSDSVFFNTARWPAWMLVPQQRKCGLLGNYYSASP